jgi:ubiquinone/menaquinone biosynthesis C-methylase UbiE
MKVSIREGLFRIWYWYVNRVDKNAEVLFMNYGHCEGGAGILLDEQNEPDRYSIQLYHQLVGGTQLKNKDIVEIGSGRGGGLYYLTKKFEPATAKGIDLDHLAVTFCNRRYSLNGLSFFQGDAQKLKLESQSCDVVINVESSHRYPDMPAFLSEVYRILRPGGFFLLTDFRYKDEMEDLKKELAASGMSIQRNSLINKQVIAALDSDDHRRRRLVEKLAPRFLRKLALNFAGTIGSETYNQFLSGKYVYFNYIMKKS